MPRFGNFWYPNSVNFFHLSHASWLKGNPQELSNHFDTYGREPNLPGNRLLSIENPFVAITILFGSIEAFRRIIRAVRTPPSYIDAQRLADRYAILKLALDCHGHGQFYQELQNEFNNTINYEPAGRPPEYQNALILQYKTETMYLTDIYLESLSTRMKSLFDWLENIPNNQEIEREIIDFIICNEPLEILAGTELNFLVWAVRLRNINVLAALVRVPDIDFLEIVVAGRETTSVVQYLTDNFPEALPDYHTRRQLLSFDLDEEVLFHNLGFSEIKKSSLKQQFAALQDFPFQFNSQHIIEQIRFIETYASNPNFISSLLPSIITKKSRFVLAAALAVRDISLGAINNSEYLTTLRSEWPWGYAYVHGLTVVAQRSELTPEEQETALFVLDYYLPSVNVASNDSLQKITHFLECLDLEAQPRESELFYNPRILQRLANYALRVNDTRLSTMIYQIPAIRSWGQTNLTLQELIVATIAAQSELPTTLLNSQYTNNSSQQSAAIDSQDLENSTLITFHPFQELHESESPSAPVPPTPEQLSKELRGLIQEAEKIVNDQPILHFLQTNKAPEIYNNFPMPRHTIFVLLHYLMRHQNVAILSALLDIQGLEHQGIGPYNETIHQFFARYFGPASKTPWAEGVALVTEKIPAMTVVEETQPEFKARTLIQATMLRDIDLVRQCLKFSPNPQTVNFAELHTKETALMIAVKNKDIEIVRVLVANKNCEVNIKDLDGNTAYMLAAKEGQREIIDILSEKADITINNRNNQDAAQLAGMNGHAELAEHLAGIIQDAVEQNKKAEAEDKRRKEYVESLGGYTKRMQEIRMLDKFPGKYLDPVTRMIMMQPITLDDGWTLDRSTIENQIKMGKKRNPMSTIDFPENVLQRQPNKILVEAIETKVMKFEKAYAAKQSKNQDDDNDVDDKVVNDPSSRA